MCISSINSEFPEDCKFYAADTKDELHKVNKRRLFLGSCTHLFMLISFFMICIAVYVAF